MNPRVVTYHRGMPRLGRAVVAIGVFDGVHLGHCALMGAARHEARRRSALTVAVTFDRDPDQIVTPAQAAPQLLSLADKCRFLGECGAEVVLVVPFDEAMASTAAEQFCADVLGGCCEVLAIHVGRDFRFGARAEGDLDTLYAWAAENGAEVRPHELVERDGAAVTSTRIRALVAAGDVTGAAVLLGRAPRVSGVVHRGRGQGADLGFPTANMVAAPFAALPADGVYAGTAELRSGASFAAAISVGTPPMFPEARDHLEAHLLGFEGDVYDEPITLTFVSRLRSLRAFASLDELVAAIAADVAATADLVRS